MGDHNYIDAIAIQIALKSDGVFENWDKPNWYGPIYRLYAVLALAKGTDTTNEDVHNAWAAWQAGLNPRHRSLIPYDDLPPEIQEIDTLYRDAIHAVAKEMGLG